MIGTEKAVALDLSTAQSISTAGRTLQLVTQNVKLLLGLDLCTTMSFRYLTLYTSCSQVVYPYRQTQV